MQLDFKTYYKRFNLKFIFILNINKHYIALIFLQLHSSANLCIFIYFVKIY